jgi:flagellum-specific peptidoglycan hydrolase FlgJ
MFTTTQLNGWLFYALFFISFTPTHLHSSTEEVENIKNLLEIIEKFTESVKKLYEQMLEDMRQKNQHFVQLTEKIVVDDKDTKISAEFEKRMANLDRRTSNSLDIIIEQEKRGLIKSMPIEVYNIYDYFTLKERISPSQRVIIREELKKIKSTETKTREHTNKLALYQAISDVMEITVQETDRFIEDLAPKTAQFLQRDKEVILIILFWKLLITDLMITQKKCVLWEIGFDSILYALDFLFTI